MTDLGFVQDAGRSDSDGLTNDTTPTFSWTAPADTSGISHYETQIDGGAWTTVAGTSTQATLAEGPHAFAVRAVDNAGFTGPEASIGLTIELTAPAQLSGIAMADDTGVLPDDHITSDATPTFSWQAAADADFWTYQYRLGAGGWIDTGNPAESSVTLSLGSGARTFQVRAVDGAGNPGPASEAFSFTIDTQRPSTPSTVSVADDTGVSSTDRITADDSLVVSWTAATDAGGVAKYQYQTDGGGWTDESGTSVAIQFTPGSHTFDVRAVDTAGNVGIARTVTIVVDQQSPGVVSHAPSGTLTAPVGYVDIALDEAVDLASLEAAIALYVDETPVADPGIVVSPLGGGNYRVQFTPQTVNGTFRLAIADSVTDAAGNTLAAAYDATFTQAIPDLAAVSLVPATTTLAFGQTVEITRTIENTLAGGPLTGNWSDAVYLSTDDILDAGDTPLGAWLKSATLSPGEDYVETSDITLPLSSELTEGTYYLILKTDDEEGIVELGESNNTTAVQVGLSMPPVADLSVTDVAVVGDLIAGSEATFTWTIHNNGGEDAVGPITEEIRISTDGVIGDDVVLETVTFEGTVPVGGSRTRSVTLTIPQTFSVSGNVAVVVATDTDDAIFESNETNNTTIAAGFTLTDTLLITASKTAVPETAGTSGLRYVVTRSGDPSAPLVVSLLSSDTTEIVVPDTITIPAGQANVAFFAQVLDDTIVDPSQVVTVAASAAGFVSDTVDVAVLDNDVPTLAIETSLDTMLEGKTTLATVSRSYGNDGDPSYMTDDPLTVTLLDVTGSQFTMPATVEIPSGSLEVTFEIAAIDDEIPELDACHVIRASAPDYTTGTTCVTVEDNDLPTLSIIPAWAEISEGAGPTALSAVVERTEATGVALTVRLTSGDTTAAVVPAQVTIPAGETSVTFMIGAVDDFNVDGTQTAIISAVGIIPACGCGSPNPTGTATAQIDVLDDDGPALSVNFDRELVYEGISSAANLIVTRNTDPTGDLVVTLTSSDTAGTELSVPTQVTIPDGETSVSVPVDSLEDGTPDGNQTVSVTGSASGYVQGTGSIVVTDVDLPDLQIQWVEGPTSVATEQLFNISYRMENLGLSEAIGSNADPQREFPGSWTQRVYLSDDPYVGDDLLVGQYTFEGTMPVGSEWGLERTVPVWAPMTSGAYYVIVETDVTGTVAEGIETNNITVSADPVIVLPEYSATVQTSLEVGAVGLNVGEITPVPLTGWARNLDNSPAQYAPVSIHISVRDTERVIAAITDEFGMFSTTWTPLPGEGGRYSIYACHPGVDEVPVQDQFVLMGMKAVPTSRSVYVIEGGTASTTFTISNLADLPLTDLSVTLADVPASLEVITTGLEAGTIDALGSAVLGVSVHAVDATYTSGTFTIEVNSGEGAAVLVPVQVHVEPLVARLSASPGSLTEGMLRGTQRVVEFEISNNGGLATGPIEVLIPENDGWLALATAEEMPSLAPGESAVVSLLLTPPADMPLAEYAGHIAMNFTGGHQTVPFSFRALSDATGDVVIKAVDEYYFYTEEKPALEGARVRVLDAISGALVFSGTTNVDGEVSLVDLNEGYYKIEVRAEDHNSYSNTVFIEAGKTNTIRAYLSMQTVQATWTVVETEIEDHCEIVIETEFETNVPAPVVTVTPGYIDLAPLTAPGQRMQIDVTIENHGLIQAEDVEISFGDHPMYEFSPLIENVGILPAKSSITVPVIIERLQYEEPAATKAGDEKATDMCHIPASVHWVVLCPGTPQERRLFSFTIGGIDYECGGTGTGGINWGGGWSGGWGGYWGGGGTGPGTVSTSTPSTGGETCDPCINEFVGAATCWADLLPCVGGAVDCGFSQLEDYLMNQNSTTWQDCLGGILQDCLMGLIDWPLDLTGINCALAIGDFLGCVFSNYGIEKSPTKDVPDANHGGVENFQWGGESLLSEEFAYLDFDQMDLSWAGDLQQPAETWMTSLGWAMTAREPLGYILGNISWMEGYNDDHLVEMVGQFLDGTYPTTEDGRYISTAERDAVLATAVGYAMPTGAVEHMIDRWNRTNQYWDNGWYTTADVPAKLDTDFIDVDVLQAKYASRDQVILESEEAGYAGPKDAFIASQEILTNMFSEISGAGVCASVKLRLEQEAVITRDAFEATLELANDTDGALENVTVDVLITDGDGNDITDLFGIYDPTIDGFISAEDAWTLSDHTTGTASWLLVPTTEAAPEEPTVVFVGATLRYTDQGREVTMPLEAVPITVLPQAELNLKYFWQRDVFSDDPWTDEIEPAQPFELAVMIENYGAGDATNLTITSAQPEIVENEKGLLIDFKIITSQVDGQPMSPSLTIDFGTIGAGETAVGQWWMTSTLQGHFVSYDATFRHVDGLGDERLSLIKNVEIFELIQSVTAGGAFDDGKTDFLTNEVADAQDLPDTLHLSDGSVVDVGLADESLASVAGSVTPNNLEVTLTATMGEGWNYLRLTDRDPSDGNYKLVSIVRGDGVVIPVENFWQTDRRFIGMGQRPVLEDSLHLLDYNDAGEAEFTYTLLYTPLDQTGPTIEEITGPAAPISEETLDEMFVEFSEPLKGGSFTWADVALTRDGGANLLDDSVTITSTGANSYRIGGLAAWTDQPGEYVVTVNGAGVEDIFSNVGTGTGTVEWTRVSTGPWVEGIDGAAAFANAAVGTLDVTFSEAIDLETLDPEDVSLTRDGQPVDLSGAFFSEVSPGVVRVGGLSAATSAEGTYEFTVDATGIADLEANLGFGTFSTAWTMDTTAPTATEVEVDVEPLTSSPATAVAIVFDEPVAPGCLRRSRADRERGAHIDGRTPVQRRPGRQPPNPRYRPGRGAGL